MRPPFVINYDFLLKIFPRFSIRLQEELDYWLQAHCTIILSSNICNNMWNIIFLVKHKIRFPSVSHPTHLVVHFKKFGGNVYWRQIRSYAGVFFSIFLRLLILL